MEEKDILKDETLEALGVIKELDTLSIIEKAQNISMNKAVRLKNAILLIIGVIIIFLNCITYIFTDIKVFMAIQLILSWVITISLIPVFKRKFI